MYIDIVVLLVSGISLYTDLTRRKIYNWVLLPAVLLALGYHIYTGGMTGARFSLGGLLLGLSLLLIPYSAGGIGAGDVKLLGTIGSLKGPAFIFNAFLAGALAGGVLSLFFLIKHKKAVITLKKIFSSFFLPVSVASSSLTDNAEGDVENSSIPYGAAIAIGTLVAYFVR